MNVRGGKRRPRRIGLLEVLEPRVLMSARGISVLKLGGTRPGRPAIPAAYASLAPLLHDSVAPHDTTPSGSALTPAQIRHAYGLDLITGDGTGQTIAIIGAYDNPSAWTDLQAFDQQFNIPDPPSFQRVAQDGSLNYPLTASAAGVNTIWADEAALDVQWSHAMAPGANIILVEASSNSYSDLLAGAVNWVRRQPGVSVVSMSFGQTGTGEFYTETPFDQWFTTPKGHAGVTFVASTGDNGQPASYPSYSPNVVAVGGTNLTLSNGDYAGETGWSGSGGGVSSFESKPSYQSSLTVSSTNRTVPDIALVADPAAVVFGGQWVSLGGTSLAAPLFAGMVAVTDQLRAAHGLNTLDGRNDILPMLYQAPAADFHDITQGDNGTSAGPGYDLVTGLGSPVANLLIPDLAGQSAHLVLMRPPAATPVGMPLAPGISVNVKDDFGALQTAGQSQATLSIVSGPTDGALGGTTTITVRKGSASFGKITLTVAGTYTLAVSDPSLAITTPVQFTQVISQGVTTVSAPHPSASYTFGKTINLAATFKSTAAKSIAFTGAAGVLGPDAAVLGAAALGANGAVKIGLADIAPGTYQCSMFYPGDANHTMATSSIFTLRVNLAGTSTALAASAGALVFGQPLTLTATVKSANAPGVVRTGSVSYYDGLTLLGTAALDGNSMASLTLTPAHVGKHAYKAVYSGDSNFKPSTSSGLGRTVSKDQTSITLTPTLASPIAVNQTFNLNVQVALLAPGASTLTGNLVTIKDNGKVLTILSLDGGGAASLPGLSYTAAGLHSLTAIYAGDADTLGVTSLALKLTIQ